MIGEFLSALRLQTTITTSGRETQSAKITTKWYFFLLPSNLKSNLKAKLTEKEPTQLSIQSHFQESPERAYINTGNSHHLLFSSLLTTK